MSTNAEKLEAVQREIKLRRRVYPRWVADKRMSQELADKQIAIFEEIAADYQKLAEGERLL